MKPCDREEDLVGYLYEEIDGHARREFDAHLAVCAECRTELEGLRATRTHLSLWAPPEPDLGFRLIRGAATPAAALPRRRLAPAFAFAAAAVIVLAVAAAIANIQIRYDASGTTVRTGWGRTETAAAPLPLADSRVAPAPTSIDTSELERRLGAIEQRFASQPAVAQSSAARTDEAELLRQVRALIEQAESRQRVALAQGLMQVINDMDRQHRADLAMLEQGTYQQQRLTNAELQQTRDIVNQFIRAASKQEEK